MSYKKIVLFLIVLLSLGVVAVSAAPTISNLKISSSAGANTTDENISVSYTANGPTLVDWRKNTTSIYLINMPFGYNDTSTAQDYTSYYNPGNVLNATWSTERNGSYDFDGVNDRIQIEKEFFKGNNTQTFSIWFKSTGSTGTNQMIMSYAPGSNGNHLQAYIESNGRLRVRAVGSYITVVNPITYNEWHNLIIERNVPEGYVVVHYDGEEISNTSITWTDPDLGADIMLGVEKESNLAFDLNGSLDDFMLCNCSLSPEVKNLTYLDGLQNKTREKVLSSETQNGDVWKAVMYVFNTTAGVRFESANLTVGPYTSDPDGIADSTTMLFVDNLNPNCDDSGARSAALNPSTPWCNTTQIWTKASAGDTVNILPGTGLYNGWNYIVSKNWNPSLTVRGYPGMSKPLISNIEKEFMTAPNNLWTNISNSTHNLWTANVTNYWNDRPYIEEVKTGIAYFVYDDTATEWARFWNHTYPANGLIGNQTSEVMTLRVANKSFNPNNVAYYLSVTNYQTWRFDNVDGLVLKDLAFKYGKQGIETRTTYNMTVDGLDVRGGKIGLYLRGQGNGYNLTVKNSNFSFTRDPNGNWTWTEMKTGHEFHALYLESWLHGVDVYNNTLSGYFNGIVEYTATANHFENSTIRNNVVFDVGDDGIEIEDYCNGLQIYQNIVYETRGTFSMVDGEGYNPDNKCKMYNNVFISNKDFIYQEGEKGLAEESGRCYKMGLNSNWDIHDNTCWGNNNTDGGNNGNFRNQTNMTYKNNLVKVDQRYAFYITGLESTGTVYDYNLYHSNYNLFKFYNSFSDTTKIPTLSYLYNTYPLRAMSWDNNSLDDDPELDSDASGNAKYYYLKANSPAIDAGVDMGLTTDYLGQPIYGKPDIGAYEYQPTRTMGTDLLPINREVTVYQDGKMWNRTRNGNTANITVEPANGWTTYTATQKRPEWMKITIIKKSGNYLKWTENASGIGNTNHTLGGFGNNKTLNVKVDGVSIANVTSDENGTVTFQYTGGYSEHTFEVGEEPSTPGTNAAKNDEVIGGFTFFMFLMIMLFGGALSFITYKDERMSMIVRMIIIFLLITLTLTFAVILLTT